MEVLHGDPPQGSGNQPGPREKEAVVPAFLARAEGWALKRCLHEWL